MRVKMLGKKAMLRNINGLSEGDTAYCGPYGTVTCICSAKNSGIGKRLFSVCGSNYLDGECWTMQEIREIVNCK